MSFKTQKAAERDRALIEKALADIKLGLLTLQFHRWDDVETGPEFARIWREVQQLAGGAQQPAAPTRPRPLRRPR